MWFTGANVLQTLLAESVHYMNLCSSSLTNYVDCSWMPNNKQNNFYTNPLLSFSHYSLSKVKWVTLEFSWMTIPMKTTTSQTVYFITNRKGLRVLMQLIDLNAKIETSSWNYIWSAQRLFTVPRWSLILFLLLHHYPAETECSLKQ